MIHQSFSTVAVIEARALPVCFIFFMLDWRRSEVFFPSFTALMMRLIWLIDKVLSPSAASTKGLITFQPSCCRTAVGVGQRALSLSPLIWRGDPPLLLAPGRVASPRHTLGV